MTPITKKNSCRLISVKGRPVVIPSKQYCDYEKKALGYCPKLGIDYPVNIKATFYMPTRRRVDLNNLLQFTDLLVKAGTITDDNSNIVAGFDGSRVCYDKKNPRTEVEIRRL